MPYSELVEIETRFKTTPGTGRPERYTVSSDSIIYFDPVPGSAIRMDLFYYPQPSEMTSDSSLPDMNAIFHPVVAAKLNELVARQLNAEPANFIQEYQIDLNRAKPLANARESRRTQIMYSGYQIREN